MIQDGSDSVIGFMDSLSRIDQGNLDPTATNIMAFGFRFPFS
jgi:hypothetical protein